MELIRPFTDITVEIYLPHRDLQPSAFLPSTKSVYPSPSCAGQHPSGSNPTRPRTTRAAAPSPYQRTRRPARAACSSRTDAALTFLRVRRVSPFRVVLVPGSAEAVPSPVQEPTSSMSSQASSELPHASSPALRQVGIVRCLDGYEVDKTQVHYVAAYPSVALRTLLCGVERARPERARPAQRRRRLDSTARAPG